MTVPRGTSVFAQASPAERYVLEQVSAGFEVDLRRVFSKKADRTLSGGFVSKLLMGEIGHPEHERHGVKIKHCIVAGDLDLYEAEIPFDAQLLHCEINGWVNLERSHFARYLSFEGSKFKSKHGADIARLKAETDVDLDGTVFVGPVTFEDSEIGGFFSANGVRFAGSKFAFGRVKVGRDALFSTTPKVPYPTSFAGPAYFEAAKIAGQLNADMAEFEGEAHFENVKVEGPVSIKRAKFADRVDFTRAQIGGWFSADGACFSSAVIGSERQGSKSAPRTRPGSRTPDFTADFSGAEVRGVASFHDGAFSAPAANPNECPGATAVSLRFDDAQVQDLDLKGALPAPSVLPELRLEGTAIHRNLTLKDMRVTKFLASSVQVSGRASLLNVTIDDEMDLRNARFLALDLNPADPMFKGPDGKLRLEGMAYEQLFGGQPDSLRNLLAWVGRSGYSANTYSRLEALLKAQGHTDDADTVYMKMKERERREVLRPQGHWLSLLWSHFLRLLVGYGREPAFALAYSTILVIIGIVVFRPGRMVGQKPESVHWPYNAFWYSIDLLTPFIDLQAASVWAPKNEFKHVRTYARIHRMLGWLLIPIGLLAVNGLVK